MDTMGKKRNRGGDQGRKRGGIGGERWGKRLERGKQRGK